MENPSMVDDHMITYDNSNFPRLWKPLEFPAENSGWTEPALVIAGGARDVDALLLRAADHFQPAPRMQCGAPGHDSVQLVPITPISRTGLWYANNELVNGVYKPTNITGGAHIVRWW